VGLLEHLGVRPDREVEVYHNARLDSGLHSYGGWYHFVGRLVGEQDDHPEPLSYGPFLVYFSRNLALVPSAFAGLPTVQLEFHAEVTWLSEIAETY
jgi:hypothetical protein